MPFGSLINNEHAEYYINLGVEVRRGIGLYDILFKKILKLKEKLSIKIRRRGEVKNKELNF
jgi:hypothetical protein